MHKDDHVKLKVLSWYFYKNGDLNFFRVDLQRHLAFRLQLLVRKHNEILAAEQVRTTKVILIPSSELMDDMRKRRTKK
jgi:hypothetical protein